MNKLKKLIEKAELAREKKSETEALEILDMALIEAVENKRYDLVLDALGHKLILWLHRYQETNDLAFLELMVADARAGYAIGIEKKTKKGYLAIMLLRIGQYHFYKKEFMEAAVLFKASLASLDKKEKGRYGEYLAFYGLALALSGEAKGATLLTQALEMVKESKDLRVFHKMSVEAGVLIKIAILANNQKDKKLFASALEEAKALALILSSEHNMPQRLAQIKKLLKNPNSIL